MSYFFEKFYKEVLFTTNNLNFNKLEQLVQEISLIRKKKGRFFFIGVGGSAANCSHAVNDFRKLCNIESYSPIDNVSEITARTNDEGWETTFSNWLKISRINYRDAIFIFSVGGGNKKKNISVNIINAIKLAKKNKTKVFSIVAREDGYAAQNSDISIILNISNKKFVTPISESFQAIIWHSLVTHPKLKIQKTKW